MPVAPGERHNLDAEGRGRTRKRVWRGFGRAGVIGYLLLVLPLAACNARPAATPAPPTVTRPPVTATPRRTVTPTAGVPTATPRRTATPTPRPAGTTTPAAPTSPPLPAGLQRGEVFAVVDGDTIDVRVGAQVVRLRLIGLDTPETVDPRRPVQCFGREASVRAHQLLDDQAVLLEADPSQGDRDRYDRLLRYLWLADGRLVNLQLIADGYAHEYTYDKPYKYQGLFKAAQTRARSLGLGLWAEDTCNGDTAQAAGTATPLVPRSAPAATTGTISPSEPALVITALVPSGGDEVVGITNQGSVAVGLAGWTLQSYGGSCRPVAGQVYAFGDLMLPPGATVRVHSGPAAAGSPPFDVRWTEKTMWNNSGDRADLRAPDGRTVSTWAYGACK